MNTSLHKFCITVLLCLAINGCAEELPTAATGKDGPAKVVVISPAIAEMLASLDLADRVTGIGQFGPWPQSMADLPVAGGYDNPNVEQVITLGADAVLNVKSEAAASAHQRLQSVGINVWTFDTSTYAGVFAALEKVGNIFNRADAAAEIARTIRRDMADIEVRTENVDRPRVLFVVGRDPLYVAGPGSHVDLMIEKAGGQNIAHDTIAPYQQIAMETILQRQPEIIIDTSSNHPGSLRGRYPGSWQQWPLLPAVQNNQVYWLDPSRMVIPGIRIAQMTRLMGKLIHPEIFGEPARLDYQKYREKNVIASP